MFPSTCRTLPLKRLLTLGVLAGYACLGSGSAGAENFLTTEEALELAFPNCSVVRETVYLTDEQAETAQDLVGEAIEGRIVYPYRATCDGKFGGTAYFDNHRVRTLPETLMVVVAPDNTLRRIEILRFDEPSDYIPKEAWYAQFYGSALSPQLDLKRDIRPVTGATLTAGATTHAARRILAVHVTLDATRNLEEGSSSVEPAEELP
ncbi:MAG: FMN-binding protein [Thermoanaerobaculia bacterium]|nr:FMN-binding protein [Thermoanaerobaculia bacterium]